jgi:hypothetical protein
MRFAEIIPDTESGFRSIIDSRFDTKNDSTDAISCRPLSADFAAAFHLVASDAGTWADFLSHPMLWPVCSRKFCDQVSAILDPQAVQIVPAPIFSREGALVRGDFFLLNPLIQVDCLDAQRSHVIWQPETAYANRYIRHIDNMTLRNGSIPPSAALFRLTGALSWLLVREDLVASLKHANCTGYALKWVGVM